MNSLETLSAPGVVPNIRAELALVALISPAVNAWDPRDAARFFDILTLENNTPIGYAAMNYNYHERIAQPHITIGSDYQGKGIGTEIYTAMPLLPLPGGENFLDSGFTLRSTHYKRSEAATALWESLVRKGLASATEISESNNSRALMQYEMLRDIPVPTHLEVIELSTV